MGKRTFPRCLCTGGYFKGGAYAVAHPPPSGILELDADAGQACTRAPAAPLLTEEVGALLTVPAHFRHAT